MIMKIKVASVLIIITIASLLFSLFFCLYTLNSVKENNQKNITELRNQIKTITDQKNQIEAEKSKAETENTDLNAQLEVLNGKINKLNENLIRLGYPQYANIKKVAYLTFDDGPSPITQQILDILQSHHIKATFFVLGKTDDLSKNMYKRIIRDGHTLALHSYTHKYEKIYVSEQSFFADLDQLKNLLVSVTGVTPKYLRFPGGSGNTVSEKYAKGIMKKLTKDVLNKGYKYFDWNVSSGDAATIHQSASTITQNILGGIGNKPEIIVLMHDSEEKSAVVEALPQVIEGITKADFAFFAIDDKTIPITQYVMN
jgi:peptidoglycan/xylan/chitin deacetylase (PgdA/CDA1 family)